MLHKTSPQLQPDQSYNGFIVKKVTSLAELRCSAIELTHQASGARVLHLQNNDPENLFSINFPTPPPDDSGIPHILEHSVLAGSNKYPVKEPFFEMIKMSMATFINAMTGPDCTYYPVASNVPKDLFNLADVYIDAVFNPLLSEHTFKREGHHLAPLESTDPSGKLTINGIVYNEMKGVFSDPESRLWRAMSRGLFPNTAYGRESGGNPAAIPQLTYQSFTDFHSHYYHPSNAYFFCYGNIPTTTFLDFLNPRLASFERTCINPDIGRQENWKKPRTLVENYPIGAQEELEHKTYLVTSWADGDNSEPLSVISMHLLELILFGNESAPLKKALIDSGLGADIIFCGTNELGREGIFSIGIKGSEADNRAVFEQLTLNTLTTLAHQGVEHNAVLAAFQQASYQYLEIENMYPLHLMSRVLQSWLYREDPLLFMPMCAHLETIRRQYQDEPNFFSRLIRQRLLDNPHRITVTLKPDQEMQQRQDQAFAQKMAALRNRLSDHEMQQIVTDAAELERLNSLANSDLQLAKLPQLAISDLPHKLSHIPINISSINGVDILRNNVFTNGINYLELDFNLQGLPSELWPIVPLYVEVIDQLGTANADYEEIARRKAATTGGIDCEPIISSRYDGQSCWGLRFTMKTLDRQIEPALALLQDLLFNINPHHPDRLRQVLKQTQAQYSTDMVHQGSSTAAYHAARHINKEGYLAEILNGLPQLRTIELINRSFEQRFEALVDDIQSIRQFLLDGSSLTVSFSGSDQAYDYVRTAITDWAEQMSTSISNHQATDFGADDCPPREGLAGPIQVAHCAMVMPAPHYSHPDETLLSVGTHLVNHDYVLNEIRFKGNAYGAWFRHDSFGRTLQLGSYNDPHIARTIDIFSAIDKFVAATTWTQAEVDRAIIATAKRELRPLRPAAATSTALQRHLAGITPELREQRFATLKTATPQTIKHTLLSILERNLPHAAVCVVANRTKLEAANQTMVNHQLAIENIL